jgi:hypothetical protein
MNPLTRPTHGMLPRRKRGLVFSLALGRGFFYQSTLTPRGKQRWSVIVDKSDFKKLPHNVNRCFVMATDKTGTEIYIPVTTADDKEMQAIKSELQLFLNSQPGPSPKVA